MADIKFSEKSPLGYNVECFTSTWDNHISMGHTIMKDNEVAVRDTISDPDYVFKDKGHPEKRSVYFSKTSNATYGINLWTTVIIDNPDQYNATGNVVTAWPTKKIKESQKKGGAIYVKSKSGSK